MKHIDQDVSSPGSSPAPAQRAVLELQLPIALASGAAVVVAAGLNLIAPTRALLAVLFAVIALTGVWLCRARLPVWSMQMALMLFVVLCVFSGVGAGGDISAAIAAGSIALAMVALPASRSLQVLATLLIIGLLLTTCWLPGAQLGIALPLLLCAIASALAVIAPLRTQIGERDAARQQADLLLGERERLLGDFRQRNDAFRRLLERESEQKALQLLRTNRELRQANDHLESFNYMVSHDIRASLRILDGLAKVLTEDIHSNRPSVALKNLHRLQTSIGTMHGMVRELLNMSRADRAELQRRKVDLGAIVRELVQDRQAAEPHRRVTVVVPDELYACGQPDLIREALNNLFCNAWKFTAQRADARIEFGVSDEGERVYYVRDNGVGIDMRRAGELFQPFKRLHNDQRFEGTGVGLASVKRIVDRHGGRVWAQAEPVQGTKLCFTLGEPSTSACEDAASVG
jgi:signal transduction histidine kinase